MHDMGVDAYRLSIAWPRLIPGKALHTVSKEVTKPLKHTYASVFQKFGLWFDCFGSLYNIITLFRWPGSCESEGIGVLQ